MHEADCAADRIDKINRATIRHINAEANAPLVCDQAVTTFEALVLRNRAIDNGDAIAVHLLRGKERCGAESMLRSDFPMNTVQTRERFRFVVRHLDTGDTQGEAMNDLGQRTQRREMFGRKLTGVHLPDVVVRVVRVVVLI